MKQYIDLGKRILEEGVWVENERTGVRCLTVINADLEYDVGRGKFPLVTTRKAPWKLAIAELLGYLRGYTNAQDFADLGAPTWFANANENEAWLKNPARKGENDMGFVYGAIARNWPEAVEINELSYKLWQQKPYRSINLIKQVVNNLSAGIDSRGEIITYWNPGMFTLGCLRPCLHSFQFSILDGTLYMNATQRSGDIPLGVTANSVSCYVFLALMAQITGLKAGKVYHKIVNAHVYENQLELFKEQLTRTPYAHPTLIINPKIKTLEDIETWVTTDDFELRGYEHHPAIKYPFTV